MLKPFIVIVEDDPKLNQIFLIALNKDFDVESFLDGETALKRMGKVVPNLIVLDLNLPGISGKDVLHAVRADGRLASARVIITSADERMAESLANEVDMVLLKPISPTQLRDFAIRLCN